jgi:hypothetical protein
MLRKGSELCSLICCFCIYSLILSNRIEFNNSDSNSIRNRIEFVILYSIRFDLRRIEFNSKFDNSIGALIERSCIVPHARARPGSPHCVRSHIMRIDTLTGKIGHVSKMDISVEADEWWIHLQYFPRPPLGSLGLTFWLREPSGSPP